MGNDQQCVYRGDSLHFPIFYKWTSYLFGIGRKTFGSKRDRSSVVCGGCSGLSFECGHYDPGIKWLPIHQERRPAGFLQTYQTAVKATWSETEWKDVQRLVVNMALPLAAILFLLVTGKGAAKEKWKRYRAQILRVILLAVSVIVPGTELLWHGGSCACWPVRFIFVITFSLVDFAVCLLADNYEKSKIQAVKKVRQKKGILLAAAALMTTIIMTLVWKNQYASYCAKSRL